MTVKEALAEYFKKLNLRYEKIFGTLPTVSWDESLEQNLFVQEPDEDGEIQWSPTPAKKMNVSGLCIELMEFFESYYYWELRGRYENAIFDFPPVFSEAEAEKIACTALEDGEYYFPKQNVAFLANCSLSGNDDLLLFYRQQTGELFLYDTDKKFVHPLKYSLVQLLGSLEALI